MKGLPFVLLFTAMTFLSWGAYGPTLHHGAMALDHDSMRAFVAVGLAYFLIAVLIPVFVLNRKGETGKWTLMGSAYSFFAGAVGAVGALGIILALAYGGRPVYVMPLVFGFAPVVNTLVTALLSRTFNQISPIFMGGVIATALGAAGVLVFKPTPPKAATEVNATEEASSANWNGSPDGSQRLNFVAFTPQELPLSESPGTGETNASESAEPNLASEIGESEQSVEETLGEPGLAEAETSSTSSEVGEAISEHEQSPPNAGDIGKSEAIADSSSNTADPDSETQAVDEVAGSAEGQKSAGFRFWGIVFSIVVAALCWGSYGPFLHIGQGKMGGSRLRPFACVGMAYFFIAVAVPMVIIYSRPEDLGAWNFSGMSWSFAAGVLGAIGALGVILAFNAGGKPFYVMPLIFGFAPVINTFISLSETDTWSLASIWFYLSLAVVIGGAVTVLTNAPRPKPKPQPASVPA